MLVVLSFRHQPAWQPLSGAKPSTEVQALRLPTSNLLTALCAILSPANRLILGSFAYTLLTSLNDAFDAQSIWHERAIAAEPERMRQLP